MLYDVLSAAYPVTNARASDWEKEFAEVQPSLNARTHTCIYIYNIYYIYRICIILLYLEDLVNPLEISVLLIS